MTTTTIPPHAGAGQAGGRSALVAGASGLVGGQLLDRLLADDTWSCVTVLVRRPLVREHPKLEQAVVVFDALDATAPYFAVDDVFCCLGTTRQQAGSADARRKVEVAYPLAIARLAQAAGAEQLLAISSLGAAPESRSLYLRLKGELEQALARLPLRTVVALRPSLLLGVRHQPRPLETLFAGFAQGLWWLMIGPLGRYRPIAAQAVAAAMVAVARTRQPGKRVIESDEIRALAAAARERT